MQQYLDAITGHVRQDLAGSSFGSDISDDDFRAALLSIDENIREHIQFLNATVHQIAAGEVHLSLWDLIIKSRSDEASVYCCYKDYLVPG